MRRRCAPSSAGWGPEPPPEAGDLAVLDFDAQCEAMLEAGPAVISSIMGLYPPAFVARMKARRHLLVGDRHDTAPRPAPPRTPAPT